MRDEATVLTLLSLLKAQATTEIEVALIDEFTQQLEKTLGEVWRDIEGHEGNYQISNYGRVKSNTKNNRVDNLQWVTYKQNLQYAYDLGRKRPPYGRKKNS